MTEEQQKRVAEVGAILARLRTATIRASNGLGEPVAKISPVNKPPDRHECKCQCRCKKH